MVPVLQTRFPTRGGWADILLFFKNDCGGGRNRYTTVIRGTFHGGFISHGYRVMANTNLVWPLRLAQDANCGVA